MADKSFDPQAQLAPITLRQTNLWGPKDFLLRMKTSRKESKETRYWLRLLDLEARPELEPERTALVREAAELVLIFSAIVRKKS